MKLLDVGLRPSGYELVARRSHRWLQDYSIKTVVDIGANVGQFARAARRLFPESRIYSFEPLEDCYLRLKQAFRDDRNFCAYQLAIGSQGGSVLLHKNEFSPSSSILGMEELHRKNFPYTAHQSDVIVQVRRLDDVLAGEYLLPDVLLKIDVQGYEDRVLSGAEQVLRQSKVVVTEMSFEFLYRDQALFDDIYRRLTAAGLIYRGNWDELRSGIDGRTLQVDAVFVRE
jgi:FkbM family methyltransferase